MSHPFQVWKQYHNIPENAFHDLLLILQQEYGIDIAIGDTVVGQDPSIITTNNMLNIPVEPTVEQSAPSCMALLQPVPVVSRDFWAGHLSQYTQLDPQTFPILNSSVNDPHTDVENTAVRNAPCVRCWMRKKECRERNNLICASCEELRIAPSLCSRVRLAETSVFVKWEQIPYERKLAWDNLGAGFSVHSVDLQHILCGPTLPVDCCDFQVANYEQISLYHKTTEGWARMETSAFALSKPVEDTDIERYVEEHMKLFLTLAHDGSTWLDILLKHASEHLQDPLVLIILHVWTAHQLLIKGWQMTVPGSLGMPLVMDQTSFLFNTIPAPRVLQNQLDSRLERYCAVQEGKYLKMLSDTMRQNRRNEWVVIFISAIILLHTRERDIHRLLYWTSDTSKTYTWRHPESAPTLIGRSLHASNILLGHLHFGGDVPKPFRDLTHHASVPEKSPKKRYNWIFEDSIDFSLCRLAFFKEPSQDFKKLSIAQFID